MTESEKKNNGVSALKHFTRHFSYSIDLAMPLHGSNFIFCLMSPSNYRHPKTHLFTYKIFSSSFCIILNRRKMIMFFHTFFVVSFLFSHLKRVHYPSQDTNTYRYFFFLVFVSHCVCRSRQKSYFPYKRF